MPTRLLPTMSLWRGLGREARRVWCGTFRVLGLCAVVSTGFSIASLREVYGEIRTSALGVGRELAGLERAFVDAPTVILNGATMRVAGRHVDMPVKDVLDRFARSCDEEAGGYEEDLAHLRSADRARLPAPIREGKGIASMRSEVGDEEGFSSCIAAPPGAHGIAALMDRISDFVATGDVAKVGTLRYVFARKSREGGGSDMITLRQEGPLPLLTLLSSDTDAPGSDNPLIPRPRGSLRTLCAEIAGTGYALRGYETPLPPATVLRDYEEQLPRLGWAQQTAPATNDFATITASTRAFVLGSAAIFVSADAEGDRTSVQVAEMGTRGAVRATAGRPWPSGEPADGTER